MEALGDSTTYTAPIEKIPSAQVSMKMKPPGFLQPFDAPDSGYNSLQNSPDQECPPHTLDWENLSKELDNLVAPVVPHVLEPKGLVFAMEECSFSVDGLKDQDAFTYSTLEIQVTGPLGQDYKVEIATDFDTLICTFTPDIIGMYQGKVSCEDFQLPGSPFYVSVFRDYANIPRPVVTLDIEITSSGHFDANAIQVRKPWGIACNPDTEQLLVTDRERHEVLVFLPSGELDFSFGKRGSGPSEFFRPTSIAYDKANARVIVGDKDNHRIQIFDNQGNHITSFGSRGYRCGQFLYPWGLAVSKCGRLIVVADTRNHRIQLFTATGSFIRQYPVRSCKTEFNHPRGVAFDSTGEYIFVSDFNLNCIFKIDVSFTTCTKIVDGDGLLRRPQGLAMDAAGNLLVTDSRHNCIKVFRPDGTFIQEFNKFSTALDATPMDLPLDVAVMRAGYLAILDLNGRVNII